MGDERAYLRVTGANVVGNLLKIVVEGGLGLLFGSLALIADAAHSVADLLASVVVLIWGRTAFTGPDSDHPHGHERIEPFTSLFVAGILALLAGKLLTDAIAAIQQGSTTVFDPVLIVGLAVAILLKLGLYRYTIRTYERVNRPSLRALAIDCLNDVYASIAVLAGVLGVAVGHPVLDPIAAAVVSCLILYQAALIVRENVSYLVGRAPSTAKQTMIRETLHEHPAVEGLHDFRAYYIGPEIEVEVHAEIADDYTLREAHSIETELVDRVETIDDVGDAHIHLDPAGIGEWQRSDRHREQE